MEERQTRDVMMTVSQTKNTYIALLSRERFRPVPSIEPG
jgi:hypothetical protein